MNARELHDKIESGIWPYEGKDTILRALDLLARVEESEDELVRELRYLAAEFEPDDAHEEIDPASVICAKTAAAIVALRAELAEWKSSGEKMAARFNEIVAKRDRLKAHAEAMASELLDLRDGRLIGTQAVVVDQYRRDFPKDAP